MTGPDIWMATFREWRSRLWATLHASRSDDELERELRAHLELAAEDAGAHTTSPEQAARVAAIQLGGVAQAMEALRDQRGVTWLREAAGDLRRAVQRLRNSPVFAATAIVSLALGIGVNTALFTLANALIMRPIAVHAPSQLIHISTAAPASSFGSVLPAAVEEIEHTGLFAGTCGFSTPATTVEINGPMAPVTMHVFTHGCFATLGIQTVLGRVLAAGDSRPGAPRVAVLSHEVWQNQFGGTPSILEQTVTIEGERYAVVGVMDRGFTGLQTGVRSALYVPLRGDMDTATGQSRTANMPLELFARLRTGVGVREATSALEVLWPAVLKATVPPEFAGARRDEYLHSTLVVSDASRGVDYGLRQQFQTPLLVLLVIASIVLLVSAVNTANLLLTRAAERRDEMLTRAALGGSRWHLLKESLAESALLLCAGVTAALLLSHWATRFLVALYGRMMPLRVGFSLDVNADVRVFLFTVGISAVAFILFGILPAWSVSRTDVVLLNGASTRVVAGASRWRKVALIAQVTLTIVLVAVGSLAVAALWDARNVPLGVGIDRVTGAQLVAAPRGYQNGFSSASYYRDLLRRLKALPGVETLALTQPMPMSSGSFSVRVGIPDTDREIDADRALVSDEFFSTLQIPLIAGRPFERNDTPRGIRTAIVSEATAQALFGTEPTVGQYIRVGTNPAQQRLEVIGIARDARFRGPLQAHARAVYLNYWQADTAAQVYPSLIVRTAFDHGSIMDAFDRTVRDGGREYTVGVRTLIDVRDQSLAREQLIAILGAAFGMLGLTLVVVGLYGLLSYAVMGRTVEIGIRMAIGAERRQIAGLIMGQVVALVVAGCLLGVAAAWAANRAVSALVYRGASFGGAPTLLAVILIAIATVAAVWFPTRRATRIDAWKALRSE